MKINWVGTFTWVCLYWRKRQFQIGVDKQDDGQQILCKSHLYAQYLLFIFYVVRFFLLVELPLFEPMKKFNWTYNDAWVFIDHICTENSWHVSTKMLIIFKSTGSSNYLNKLRLLIKKMVRDLANKPGPLI